MSRGKSGAFPRLASAKGKSTTPSPRSKEIKGVSDDIYQPRVTLLHSRPAIWRRLLVPTRTKLSELHAILQGAFGWHECHLHQFTTADDRRFTDQSMMIDSDEDLEDERKATLADHLSLDQPRMLYEYDFGDGWEHGIELQEVIAPDPKIRYPRCVAGKNAGPPEDCGGVWGYADLIKIMKNPQHPEHAEYREWLGRDLDPTAFDIEEVDARLAHVR